MNKLPFVIEDIDTCYGYGYRPTGTLSMYANKVKKEQNFHDLLKPDWVAEFFDSLREEKFLRLEQYSETIESIQTPYETFVQELKAGSNLENIRSRARDILLNYDGIISSEINTFAEELRALVPHIENENLKAVIMQLMSELGDQNSSQIFLNEIIKHSKEKKGTEPKLSTITAITYANYLKLNENYRTKLVSAIMEYLSSHLDTQSSYKKQLIIGSIITLGSIGTLDEICQLFLSLLQSEDQDTQEEVLDSLTELWIKEQKENNHVVLNKTKKQISLELLNLIKKYNLSEEDSKSITPVKQIVSRAYNLLAMVDTSAYIEIAKDLLMMALIKDSSFLLASFKQSFHTVLQSIKAQKIDEKIETMQSLSKIFASK